MRVLAKISLLSHIARQRSLWRTTSGINQIYSLADEGRSPLIAGIEEEQVQVAPGQPSEVTLWIAGSSAINQMAPGTRLLIEDSSDSAPFGEAEILEVLPAK